ncbi:AI-2E family transporter [Pleomorphovibrio marinus]|uniref:AI-2E family transporter n=1 Tax=Pleomorphovibrio marinus TaxID=2164132 RepID=UPI000E0C0AF4|nr:AI-2E family transporter [Pleomorphovibrio marinus]
MQHPTRSLMHKTLTVTFVVVIVVALFSIFTLAFSIFLLAFGGILFSLFFHSISVKLQDWTGWKRGVTLSLSVLMIFLFYAGLSFLIGNQVSQQYDEFAEKVPDMVENLKSQLNETIVGEKIVDKLEDMENDDIDFIDNFQAFFRTTFGFFGDFYAVLFFGIFFMVNPAMYVEGFGLLIPSKERDNTLNFLRETGGKLKVWLRAIVLEMIFVFLTTAIGLFIMGIDLWLILAIMAGFLTFIPNIGPALAIIPAFLVGLLSGFQVAFMVVGLYLLVQVVESGIFGPFIRQKLLSLPPALVLFFQLLMGLMTGVWGVLFATPLLVVIINLVQEYYVERAIETEASQ